MGKAVVVGLRMEKILPGLPSERLFICISTLRYETFALRKPMSPSKSYIIFIIILVKFTNTELDTTCYISMKLD